MERERATRCAQRGLGARRFIATTILFGAPLLLGACETLPGFGTPPPPPPVAAAPPPAVAPPPPRPRTPGTPVLRFRIDPVTSGPATTVAEAPMPPPAIEAAPQPGRADVETVASAVSPPAPPRAASPPLAGDSAATEVARAEPAAAPPVPAAPIQPPPPSIDPASLRGATATELRDRFGAPSSQNPIASGTAWHYERAACKATFVLLPELTSGALRVFSYEITPGEGAMFGPAGCLGRIAVARSGRNAGIAP